jgi:hypothetical protein
MLSEHHLLANLQALARAGVPAPPLGRVDPDELRLVEANGRLTLAIRGGDASWVVLGDDDAGDLSAVSKDAGATICLIGTRAGRTIDAVAARRPDARILALEPDPTHALILLSQRNWSDAITAGRLTVLVGPNYPGGSSAARAIDGSIAPPIITDPLLAAHRSASARGAAAILDRLIGEARANAEARRQFAPRYLLQTLQNLPVIAREADAASLHGLFTGTPAVIVGAGPSLDENLGDLVQFADRTLIVAADTTLAPLESAGIQPPLVVAVDPSEWNARHLAAPHDVDDTWMVAEGSLHPSTFERFAGRTFTFEVSGHEPWPWLAGHGLTRGRLRAWGSVITSAFDLALRMGCNPIVFAGLDLAFTGGRTYCRHTAHEEIWGKWIEAGDTWENVWAFLMTQVPQQREIDLHGAPAVTSPYLAAFRNWLVEQIAAAPADRTFANTTGAGLLYGARIEQRTLADALAGTASIDPATVQNRLASAHRGLTTRPSLKKAALAAASSLRNEPDGALDARWRRFTAGTLDSARTADILTTVAESLAS